MAIAVPNIATAFASAFASGSQIGTAPRVAMRFTSRLRLVAAEYGGRPVATGPGVGLPAFFVEEATLNVNAGRAAKMATAFPFLDTPVFQPTIAMALNPKSVRFTQPKRFTKKDTREGSVFFHFGNARGQNLDVMTMSFTGNTGNIDRRGSGPGTAGADTGAMAKLVSWHNLYLLTREPMLLGDGTRNEMMIVYSSALMPFDVTFFGFFSKTLEFEESAEKPNSRDYNFEFIVQRTSPSLDSLLSTLGNFITSPPGGVTIRNVQDGDVGTQ